jgi:hypothetical protein
MKGKINVRTKVMMNIIIEHVNSFNYYIKEDKFINNKECMESKVQHNRKNTEEQYKKTEIKLYIAKAVSTLTYGSQMWTTSIKNCKEG